MWESQLEPHLSIGIQVNSPFRTVVVDLDDTLLASARARLRALKAMPNLGIEPRRFAAADRRWWKVFETGGCTIEELRVGRWRDCGLTGEAATLADTAYRSTVNSSVRQRRGARRFLLALREAGIRTVILTNGIGPMQRSKLDESGLMPLVDGVVISAETGYSKPHPEAFNFALNLVGGTPEGAAMVGDSLEADVTGALGAGFQRVFWMTSRRPHSDPRVTSVRHLDEALGPLTNGWR